MNEIISVMFHLEWIQRGKPTQSYKHVKKLIYDELKKKNGNIWWASGTGRTWGERKRTKTGDKRTHSNVRLMGAGSWTFGKGAGRWWGEIQVSRWSTSVKVRSEESVPNAVLQGANGVNRRAILVGVAAEGWREDEDYSWRFPEWAHYHRAEAQLAHRCSSPAWRCQTPQAEHPENCGHTHSPT